METDQYNINFIEIIERITDAFFALDHNWNFTYINQKGAEMLKNDQKELIGKNVWDEFPFGLKNNFYKHYIKAMEEQETVEFEEYYPEPLDRWYHARAYPSSNGISVFFHDVTEQKMKQKLNDAYFEQLFEQNYDGIISLDLDGTITGVNAAIERITGFNCTHVINKKYNQLSFIHTKDMTSLQTMFEQAIKGVTQNFTINLIHKSGYVIHGDLTFFSIKVMDEIVGVYGVLRDISQIKELEWNLRRSEQKYRSLKSHNPDGICSFDLNGNLVGVNPALEKMTGYTKEEIIKFHLHQLFSPHDVAIIQKYIQEILDGRGIVDSFDMTLINKSGNNVHTFITIVPIYIEDILEGFYLIIKDVTKTKKAEELVIRSEKLAAVGQLAASIVHEIRNPLTSLIGFLQLIKHNYGVKDEYVQIMSDELMRINSITNELLILAKPQAKKMKRKHIESILVDVVTLMNSQAFINDIEINLQCDENIPEIKCDDQQLKQVFINLIKNGIEAMDGKPGEITVIAKKTENNQLVISFSDQGMGMTKEQIEHIGEPFYTTKQKGTGLGMLMTNSIIQNHNGKLEIESEIGNGTTIHIYLPIR